jgi:hypothetical protein
MTRSRGGTQMKWKQREAQEARPILHRSSASTTTQEQRRQLLTSPPRDSVVVGRSRNRTGELDHLLKIQKTCCARTRRCLAANGVTMSRTSCASFSSSNWATRMRASSYKKDRVQTSQRRSSRSVGDDRSLIEASETYESRIEE